MTDSSAAKPRKSLFRLIGDIPGLLSQLVRDEIEQLKAELTTKLKSAALGIGLLAAAATVGVLALITLVFAAILGLAVVLPTWAAALVVSGVLLIIVLILALVGRAQLKRGTPPMPTNTISSIRKDVNTIKGIGKRD
jgi:Putative Actinobacterial Holin-X, holin superfamily III